MDALQQLEEAKYNSQPSNPLFPKPCLVVGYSTAKLIIEKLVNDNQILLDRLVDFNQSHREASKRDLDKYRELEKKFKELLETIGCPECYNTNEEYIQAIQQEAKKITL